MCVAGGKTPDMNARTYAHIMQEARLKGEEALVSRFHLFCVISLLLFIFKGYKAI